jgi:hypothetical protein
MLSLKSFNQAYLCEPEELEARDEIFSKYKYALAYLGIDFYIYPDSNNYNIQHQQTSYKLHPVHPQILDILILTVKKSYNLL